MCLQYAHTEVKFGISHFIILFLISDLEPIFHVPIFVVIEIFLAISGLILFCSDLTLLLLFLSLSMVLFCYKKNWEISFYCSSFEFVFFCGGVLRQVARL